MQKNQLYAVKVVPKASLTRTKARQKVNFGIAYDNLASKRDKDP